jgi:sortase (surface protein transpeptidase)
MSRALRKCCVTPLLPARVFLIAGLLGLGYAAYIVIDTQAYQATEHRRLDSARSGASSAPVMIADEGVIGEIHIPRLGLRAIVAQGDSPSVLQRAVGHLAMSCSRAIGTLSSGR